MNKHKHIAVPKEFHAELKAFCEDCGISMSSFVRAASRNYYEIVKKILGMRK